MAMSTQERRRALASRMDGGGRSTEDIMELRRLLAVMERRQRFSFGRVIAMLILLLVIGFMLYVALASLAAFFERKAYSSAPIALRRAPDLL